MSALTEMREVAKIARDCEGNAQYSQQVKRWADELEAAQKRIAHLEATLEAKTDSLRVRDSQLEEARQVAREKAHRVAELEAQASEAKDG